MTREMWSTMRWAWKHVDGSTASACAMRGVEYDHKHCIRQWDLWFRLIARASGPKS